MDLKKEMEDKRAMGNSPIYAQVKTEVMYEKDDDIYNQPMHHDKHDAPIDLIYDDGNKTVIYTTAPHQKGLEMYSQNAADITINDINGHHIQGPPIGDVLIDGNSGAMVAPAPETGHNPPGTVSVILQGNGQGLLQYPQSHVPGATVLVVSDLVDDMGLPVVGLR